MLNLDSMEDTMVDILVDTMAMEAMCITWARGLLADAEPGFYGRYYGGHLGGYHGYGGYVHYLGKRSADADAVATADADADPGFYGRYYGGHLGGYLGYGGYGGYGHYRGKRSADADAEPGFYRGYGGYGGYRGYGGYGHY